MSPARRFLRWVSGPRRRAHEREVEAFARLERAEAEIGALRERADRAGAVLAARKQRNHWQETVDRLWGGTA